MLKHNHFSIDIFILLNVLFKKKNFQELIQNQLYILSVSVLRVCELKKKQTSASFN